MDQDRLSKVIVLTATLFFFIYPLPAQFSEGRLQATGLTCALCSKSIHQALNQIPSIESVAPDLKSSSFNIRFKSDLPVSVQEIRAAVEDAGFFVGEFRLTLASSWTDSARAGARFGEGGSMYQLLGEWKEEQPLQVVAKGFLSEKEYKRFAGRYPALQQNKDSLIYLFPTKN